MPVELYAVLLLALRIISVTLLFDVINKQTELRRRPIRDKRAAILRKDMFKLSWVAMSMNVVPIIVDVLTLLGEGTRPNSISWLSVAYVFSYSLGTLFLTLIIYRMYRKSLEY